MPSRPTLGAAVALALSCLVACGESPETPNTQVVPGQALRVESAGGLATGTVRLDGDRIQRGPNTFLVGFDPSTTEISAASTLMPVHGHGSTTPALAREGADYRVSNVVFNMPGLWEVRLELTIAGTADRLVFDADVP